MRFNRIVELGDVFGICGQIRLENFSRRSVSTAPALAAFCRNKP